MVRISLLVSIDDHDGVGGIGKTGDESGYDEHGKCEDVQDGHDYFGCLLQIGEGHCEEQDCFEKKNKITYDLGETWTSSAGCCLLVSHSLHLS